jgi:glycosyltransferase involved in cell wall biosynthesis
VSGSRPIRICLVGAAYPPVPCGVGHYMSLLAQNLAALGAEVSVVTSAGKSVPGRRENPRVFPVVTNWTIRHAARALRAIQAAKPDIVHFHVPDRFYTPYTLHNLLVAMTKAIRPSTRVVVTYHELLLATGFLARFRPVPVWFTTRAADAFVVVAERFQDDLHTFSPRARRIPVKVIANASQIPRSQLTEDELSRLRAELGVASETLLIGYFGFAHPAKGCGQLLDLLVLLRRRDIAAALIVVGEWPETSDYHRGLLAQIKQQGLENAVHFCGYLNSDDTVADHLALCDACVFPFRDGIYPNATSHLAATSQGVFTVISSAERHGLSEVENVYYVRPGNVSEMASALVEFRGRRLPHRSVSGRTSMQVAEDNLNFYHELLLDRATPPPAPGPAKVEGEINEVGASRRT